MKHKPKDYTLAAIAFVVLIAVLASSCKNELPQPFYYNAYSPTFDEFFIIRSYKPLAAKQIVWFDHAQVVEYATPYMATIISPYNK